MTDLPPDPAATTPSADEAVDTMGVDTADTMGVDETSPVESAATPARTRSRVPVIIALGLLTVLLGGALFLSGWTMGRQAALTPGTPVDEAEAFQPFWDTWRAVTERYAGGDVDRKKLIEGSIKGMIGALEDPYSMYLTSDEFKESLRGISGEFEGIGATIGTVDAAGKTSGCTDLGPDCRMVIVAPIPESPAEKAGLEPGDIVIAIDGTPVAGQTLEEARSKVRGPKDTAVVLTVERDGGAPMDIEIVRAVIISPEVDAKDLADGKVGYVRLIGFSDHAAEELARVTEASVKAGKEALILDLRGNPGGFVTAARSIASQYLDGGTVFWEEDADGNLQETVAEARRLRDGPGDPARGAGGRWIGVGIGDRGRRPPGPGTREAGWHEDVRQGHGPAVDAARGRLGRLPAHGGEVAHAGQDVDPPGRDHARRGRGRGPRGTRRRPGP